MKTKALHLITRFQAMQAPIFTYWRLTAALLMILMAALPVLRQPVLFCTLICTALLSMSIDGSLARKQKRYSAKLRRMDSNTDVFMWITALLCIAVLFPSFMKEHLLQIMILLASELGLQLFGLYRFDKANALHTYSAKAWAVLLGLTVINLCAGNEGRIVFNVAFIWGCLSQLESFFILSRLQAPRIDVKSVFHL